MNHPPQRDRWRPHFSVGVIAAAVFTALYVLAAAAGAVVTGNAEFIFYLVVMAILIGAVLLVHWRVRLPTPLLWCLAVWGGLHMAGGLVTVSESWPIHGENRVLYSWWVIPNAQGGGWLKFDHLVHAFGFGVTTWLCWVGLCAAVRRTGGVDPRPTLGLLTLCVAAATGFGALNEIIEFAATRITQTNVGGYVNTGLDLISNLAGALMAAAIIALRARRRSSTGG